MPKTLRTIALLACMSTLSLAHAEPPEKQTVITISKETTYFTEPLTEDGFVDYIAALNNWRSEGVTPENNFVVGLLEVMEPDRVVGITEYSELSEEEKQAWRDRCYRLLGIAESPAPAAVLQTYDAAVAAWIVDMQLPYQQRSAREKHMELCDMPWRAEDHPRAARWLKHSGPLLDEVAKAAQRPIVFWPVDAAACYPSGAIFAIELPFSDLNIELARSFEVRMNYRIACGDVRGAFADIQTLRHMARHAMGAPCGVELFVAYSNEKAALRGLQRLLDESELSSEEAKRMLREFDAMPELSAISIGTDRFERVMALDAASLLARTGGNTLIPDDARMARLAATRALLTAINNIAIDWDVVHKRINKFYDQLSAALAIEDYAIRRERLAEIEHHIESQKASVAMQPWSSLLGIQASPADRVSIRIISLLAPAMKAFGQAEPQTDLARVLGETGLALAAYEADHGEYPEELKDLTPDYMAEIPRDLFTDGRPLRYARTETGYRLYSVGPNGEDDNGADGGRVDGADDYGIIIPHADGEE